ncbi:hypothetical protein FQA39_LY11672 [Lamprigera yunnana]|nr:hypothetical protein FQA39_LY11672 [Lamprigera yunnana]
MKANIFVLIAISLQCICALYIESSKVDVENYERNARKICVPMSKVPPQMGNDLTLGSYVYDKELKEFVFCYDSLMGLFNKEGNINKDIIKYDIDGGEDVGDGM